MRRRRLLELASLAALIVVGWIGAGLFLAFQHHVNENARGRPDDLLARTQQMMAAVLISAVLTPIVIYAAQRFPLRRPKLARNAAFLLLFIVAITAVRAVLDGVMSELEGDYVSRDAVRHGVLLAFHAHFVFTSVIAAVVNLVELQREAAERQRREVRFTAELAKARLRRLRADLQPHFLFNTLNAVAALVHTDAGAAEKTIATLSDLLRRSLAAADRLEVPLIDDLEFVERYLDIQKTRFGARLRTHIAIEDERLLDALIPPLLLQPLVENSIVHGVAPRPSGGRVEVRVFSEGGSLRLQVRDDGPGAEPEQMFGRGSVGLPNTRARLEYLYGDRHSFAFRREEGEFVADVTIPLVHARPRAAVQLPETAGVLS